MLVVTARAPLRPTEDPARVEAALKALFPTARVVAGEGELRAEDADLDRLRELVRSGRIPDTARGQMLKGLAEDGTRAVFHLGKQAAAVGRAHFGALGGPLGEIEVEVRGAEREVERAIYRAAPDTTVPIELAEIPVSERPAAE